MRVSHVHERVVQNLGLRKLHMRMVVQLNSTSGANASVGSGFLNGKIAGAWTKGADPVHVRTVLQNKFKN